MIRKLLTCGALGAALLISGTVVADGPFEKPIKARQGMFQLISFRACKESGCGGQSGPKRILA